MILRVLFICWAETRLLNVLYVKEDWGWNDLGAASVRLLSEATIVPLKKRWYSGVPRYAVPSFDRLPASVSVLGRISGSGLVKYEVAQSAAPFLVQPILYEMFLRRCV